MQCMASQPHCRVLHWRSCRTPGGMRLIGSRLVSTGGSILCIAWMFKGFVYVCVCVCAHARLCAKHARTYTHTHTYTHKHPQPAHPYVCQGFLDWGYKAGCDFVAKTCTDYTSLNPGQRYYCTREEAAASDVNAVCTFDGNARAKCENAQFADGCLMKVGLLL